MLGTTHSGRNTVRDSVEFDNTLDTACAIDKKQFINLKLNVRTVCGPTRFWWGLKADERFVQLGCRIKWRVFVSILKDQDLTCQFYWYQSVKLHSKLTSENHLTVNNQEIATAQQHKYDAKDVLHRTELEHRDRDRTTERFAGPCQLGIWNVDIWIWILACIWNPSRCSW